MKYRVGANDLILKKMVPRPQTPGCLRPNRRHFRRIAVFSVSIFLLLVFGHTVTGFAQSSPVFVDVTQSHLPDQSAVTTDLAIGDVDGDGDIDIVDASHGLYYGTGQIRLYLNNGQGHYTEVTSTHVPIDSVESNGLTLGDIEGDGDLDLFSANRPYGSFGGGENTLYLNDGNGYFTDVSHRLLRYNERTKSGILADLTGDGAIDLLTASGPSGTNRVYVNDGTGHFQEQTTTYIPVDADTLNIYRFLPADVDGDWDLDIILVNAWRSHPTFSRQHEEIWLNDGSGHFTRRQDLLISRPEDAGQDGDVYELNGDGFPDFVVGQVEQSELYLSSGPASYINVTTSQFPATNRNNQLRFGDMSGDGQVDLFLGNGFDGNQLFLQRSGTAFVDCTTYYLPDIPINSTTRAVEVLDADDDSRLDLLLGSSGDGQNRLYLNTIGLDTVSPLMAHDPHTATRVDSAGTLHLRVWVQDASRWIRQVVLVRDTGGLSMDTINAVPVGGDLFHVARPTQEADAAWPYYWIAEDWAGNQSRLPAAPAETFTWPGSPNVVRDTSLSSGEPVQLHLYPNPFNSQMQMTLSVPASMRPMTGTFRVLNIRGQLVQTITYDVPTEHSPPVIWSGDTRQGRPAPSGCYIVQFAGETIHGKPIMATQKVLLLR